MPPTGRMKKPTPKVAVVSKSDAYWLSAGKNRREMTTAKNPKTMKSYHSSALPMTAAATCSGFDAKAVDGMVDDRDDMTLSLALGCVCPMLFVTLLAALPRRSPGVTGPG